MRVLVTGGSGFIGTNLIDELREWCEVVNVDPRPPRDQSQSPLWRASSVLDRGNLIREFKRFRPDSVVHLGARTDLRGQSVADYSENTDGVDNVISAVKEAVPGAHTLYASSRLVFAVDHQPVSTFDYKPSTAYGKSKVEGERAVIQRAGDAGPWTIVRPTSIWGPWFAEPYRDFFDMVASGRYVKFRDRDPLKSFGYVGNVVYQLRALILAGSRVDERTLWLSDYEPLRLSEWADAIADALGRRRPGYAPWFAAQVAAGLGDVATRLGFSRVPLTTFRLNNIVTNMTYDTSDTQTVVGDLPYSMAEGVERTVEWYRSTLD